MRKACLVAVFALASVVQAQNIEHPGFANKEECKQLCQSFMVSVAASDLEGAFLLISPYWLFGSAELDKFNLMTVKQIGMVGPRFGASVGFEFVREEMVNDTVIRFTYVQKRERHILRWLFMFYKPKDRWLLNSFKWDDKMDQLFK